jgi:putative ABC transport system substrate-binding protein
VLGLTLVGGSTWAAAQTKTSSLRVATVGSEPTQVWDVFQRRLAELGYVEGRNLVLERRWSHGFSERVPALVAELLATRPDVLVTSMLPPPPRIDPSLCTAILAIGVAEPYADCRVVPVARLSPASSAAELSAVHLRLIRLAVPAARRIAVVTSSDNAYLAEYVRALDRVARSSGVDLIVVDASDATDVIGAISRQAPEALVVGPGFGVPTARRQLVGYATRRGIPAVGSHLADGVMIAADYDWVDLGRRAADFVDRLVKGTKAAELPVDTPIKLGIVVDRRAARSFGLTLPESLVTQADQILD